MLALFLSWQTGNILSWLNLQNFDFVLCFLFFLKRWFTKHYPGLWKYRDVQQYSPCLCDCAFLTADDESHSRDTEKCCVLPRMSGVWSPVPLWLNLAESNPTVALSGDNRSGFVVGVCPQRSYSCTDSPLLTMRESRIMCLSLSESFSPRCFSRCFFFLSLSLWKVTWRR